VSASKPRLLNVTLWLSPFRNGPKCWDKWTAMFVYRNCVQSYFDVLAKAGVMKAQRDKCEISGERSETYARWNAVRSNGIPYGYTFYRAGVMKRLPLQ
jgi:hypothetical protein